jgi:alkylation response protein AidB-like acyl-CoA dehydrogenase
VRLPDARVHATPIPTLNGLRHFCQVELDGVFVPNDMVLGEIGDGWGQVVAELGDERGGPERYLSTFPLLAALADELRADLRPELVRDLGILVSRLSALRAVAVGLLRVEREGEPPRAVRAAAFKGAATEAEADVIALVRRSGSLGPHVEGLLADAIAVAPAAGLRGGTTQIMEGIVARGLEEYAPGLSASSPTAPARMTEAMEQALALVIEHTTERHQFGAPLRSFQAVQSLLARIATETLLAREVADHAARCVGTAEAKTVADVAIVQASIAAGRVAEAAHQAIGALGFTRQHPLGRLTASMLAERDEWAAGERVGRAVLARDSLWEGMVEVLGWDESGASGEEDPRA